MTPLPFDPTTQIAYSGIAVWLIELAKKAPWLPWITTHTATMNRWAAIVTSGLTTAGVVFTATGTAAAGGEVTIVYPSLQVGFVALLHWVVSFVLQETIYRAAVPAPAAVVATAPMEPIVITTPVLLTK